MDVSVPPTVRRGQSLVEFALTIPIFLLFTLGIIEVGRVMYTMAALSYGAERGARVGALPSFTTPSDAEVKTAVRENAYLVTIDPNHITVAIADSAGTPIPFTARDTGDRITVTITHTYQPIVRSVFPQAPTIPMSGRAEREVE